jgi:DNA-binding transcriptional ArsR family regulator
MASAVETDAPAADAEQVEQLLNRIASFVEAFGHPLRLRIMAWSCSHDEKLSPVRVAEDLGETLASVAYHVRKLRDLGLLRTAGSRRRRGAIEHLYVASSRGRELLNSIAEVCELPNGY